MAKLDSEAAGSARAQVESELARVQHALAASEDARQKWEVCVDRGLARLSCFKRGSAEGGGQG